MKKIFYILILLITTHHGFSQNWELVWQDEFDYNGLPDPTKWGYDTGNSGWGNNELENYTSNRVENARAENGNLIIEARRDFHNGIEYSSARLVSRNKGDWKYGRVEVRAKIPIGAGMWPAIWMLPTDWVYGGWPGSGEIDIMENFAAFGIDPSGIHGNVHTQAYNHTIGTNKGAHIGNLSNIEDNYHIYAIDWYEDHIDFEVDGIRYFSFANEGNWQAWPFDQRFHLILNIAVGGNLGGNPDPNIFPKKMIVDYVRVYNQTTTSGQTPFTGSPIAIPGIVEFEDYDKGGENIAYHDLTSGNQDNMYRSDDVDIEACSEGGYNVGWVQPGEWIEYTVDVAQTASYNFNIRTASEQSGSLRIELDGQDVAGVIDIPTTGNWQQWSTVTKENIELVAGKQVMRVHVLSGEFNLNFVDISENIISGQTPFHGTPVTIPGIVEFEDYDNGGEDIAYHDLTANNEGGVYRDDAADIEVCSEGGYNIGWVQPEEWVEYTIDVAQTGIYDFNIRCASEQSGAMRVELNEQDITGTITIPATGGWQNWITVHKQNVTLTAGIQVMRVYMLSGEFNLNYVDISQNNPSAQTPFNGVPVTIPGIVEFEDYDNGGEGIAYHDLTANNEGTAYRDEDADIEPCSEGGYNIGWVDTGEWLEYTLNITKTAMYDFSIRSASEQSGTMRIELDGQDITGNIDIPATRGWQHWNTVRVKNKELTSGQKVMRIYITSGEFNLNYIDIAEHNTSTTSDFSVVGYLPSWSGSTNTIQYDKLTHINYAFIRPTSWGGLTSVDNPDKLASLVHNAHAQHTKVGIAIGGWSDLNNNDFEIMAASASTRTTFINNVMSLIHQYNLDGADIDWEYPIASTGANYDLLMRELGQALHAQGKYLTAAVVGHGDYYGQHIHNSVFEDVDFLNIMAYDGGSPHSSYAFAQDCTNYWLGRGLPANKLVLGVPFYGRSANRYVSYRDLLNENSNAQNLDVVNGVEYNGIPTIKAKTQYAIDNNLGGIMIWEISQDVTDHRSLLSAINNQIQSNKENTTSIPSEVTENGEMKIVPNPAESQIKIIGLQKKARVDITDMAGNKLRSFKYTGASAIDISSLPKGLFIINVITLNGVKTLKLVK
ncbi:carbohydrate-binding protein [Aquimarina sp. RZ0]|uniref:carbohydrate-binding protein n=1 Tax=Aquimarina sp. RZ0 TaxID=2607730 RepID=UPI001CB6FDDD|nr:carbohydrate-binding protein [Aquimarina sp. RZ0]